MKKLMMGVLLGAVLTPLGAMGASAVSQPLPEVMASQQGSSNIKIDTTKKVPFTTRTISDSALPAGVKITVTPGKDGVRSFYTASNTVLDDEGRNKDIPVHYDEITVAPVQKVVRVGTNKATAVSGISDKTKKIEKDKAAQRDIEKRIADQIAAKERFEKAQAEKNDALLNSDGTASTDSSDTSEDSTGTMAQKSPTDTKVESADASSPSGRVTTPAENRAYAQSVLSASEFAAADELVMRESGWSTTALNPNGGAYGVAQSLPAEKMASAGSDWKTNGKTQFKWMIGYVKERYGSFQSALRHSHSQGWY